MSNLKFTSNMPKSDFLALAKELKISLKATKMYERELQSFDADVSGAYINILHTADFKPFIKSRIHTFQPSVFKYSEIFPVLPLIFDKMEPSDFKVRVYGSVYADTDYVTVNIQFNELMDNFKRIWEKKCITDITPVTALSTFNAAEQEFFKSFRFEKSPNVCFSVLVTSENKPVQMENVTACRMTAPIQYILQFNGYCSLKFANGAVISFKFVETERGAAPELYAGYYVSGKYYKKKIV